MTSPTLPRHGRHIASLGGAFVFAASLVYFAIAYAWHYGTPAEASVNAALAVTINVLLFGAFALHHSVLARSGIKARLAGIIPPAFERTVYVWIASVLFIVVCAGWQLVPGTMWRATGPVTWLFHAVQIGGALIAIGAGRAIDVGEFTGVRPALHRTPVTSGAPATHGPYGAVRHPLYLGLLLALWAMPLMTGTRFVFALVSTIYVLIAIPMEERDLQRAFGEDYAAYRRRVRSRLLPGVY